MHIESLGGKYFDGAFTYLMKDLESGKIMGASHFEIGEKGLIYSILEPQDSDDFEAMFILARQTMNFIDACGAHYCEADPSYTDARLLRAIGFRETSGKWSCSLEGMFDGSHCDGKAKEL
jgi:hypothetical protein